MLAAPLDLSSKVHEFLSRADSYSDRPSRVEVKETHISWVYLTDRFAYKQKKPVAFEFLDFSELSQRKFYCDQELKLNRRFSPNVYLRTVPVWVDATGKPSLKRGHEIVEWLVKMVRLDESMTLQSLLEQRRMTPQRIAALSKRLVEIYAEQAPAIMRSDDYLLNLRAHVLANAADLLLAFPRQEAFIQYITNTQLQALTLYSEDFRHRVADGRVVDGHGDLRPEHIYFQRDQPQLIDCVEFSSEYRTNDVVDEVSFLAMECDRLGRPSVGEAILNDYFASTTDRCLASMIAFFKCYRACVRAKVAALRSMQGAEKSQVYFWKVLAQSYLDLAQEYTADISQKTILVVGGLSGAGKSTLASQLRDQFAAQLLQTDRVRNDVFSPATVAEEKYTDASRRNIYRELLDRATSAFKLSPTVILDGTFAQQDIRHSVVDVASVEGAQVVQIQCECPVAVAKERIAKRLAEVSSDSEATPALVDEQIAQYEPPLESFPTIHVDTTAASKQPFDKLVRLLRVEDGSPLS